MHVQGTVWSFVCVGACVYVVGCRSGGMYNAEDTRACTQTRIRMRCTHTHTHRLEDFVVLEQLLAFREERLSLARFHGRILCFVHLLSYSTTRADGSTIDDGGTKGGSF